MTIKINDTNIQVDFKEDNKLWGISFVKKEDNSEELNLIREHATDEEMERITEEMKG